MKEKEIFLEGVFTTFDAVNRGRSYYINRNIIYYEKLLLKMKQNLRKEKLFSNQGHSGCSASRYANTLASTIKDILLWNPISPINNFDDEWDDVDNNMFQHKRNSAVFKDGKDDKSYFLDAIVWQGVEDWDTFTGKICDTYSSQFIKFPFTPKTFYIDVIRVYDSIENIEKLGYNYSEDFDEDGMKTDKVYYTIIKDKSQLLEVAKYYDMIDTDRVGKDVNHYLKTSQRKTKINKILND